MATAHRQRNQESLNPLALLAHADGVRRLPHVLTHHQGSHAVARACVAESIQIHLRSLEALGLVISTPRTDENGRSEANEYFLPKLKEAIDEAVAKKNRKSSAKNT